MLAQLRSRLTYANVMATIAVFIALGGSSYAALQITGKQVKNSSLTGADVKNRSLRAIDFRRRELPAGPRGDRGPSGAPGPKGDTGMVDTSQFYGKAASDARFLGIGATAADARLLDGSPADSFRASAVHDQRLIPAYSVGGGTDLRSVTLSLKSERRVLIIGNAEAWSGADNQCRSFIWLTVDGTLDTLSPRGETAPAVAGLNGFATAATTTLRTLGPGTHTVTLVGLLPDGAGCVGFQHSSLDAVLLDG